MQVLCSYNFEPDAIADQDFEALYRQRRRDATFAFAYEHDGRVVALRDHLGIVPLYYRFVDGGVQFSTDLSTLVQPGDELNPEGVLPYLKFGTSRLVPLVKGIHYVLPGTVIEIDPLSQASRVAFAYQLHPRRIGLRASLPALVDEFETLFVQAIQRLVRHDTVGLYLSGGIDSALIGIYLCQAGVKVNAYTSAPWGKTSSETPYAETNARVIQAVHHFVDNLETGAYPPLMQDLPALYGMPHGTPTGLGVTSLWKNTPISSEQQIFFGQNSDTLMGCMLAQYVTYFAQFLPGFVRQRVHPRLHRRALIANYLSFAQRFSGDTAQFCQPQYAARPSTIQKLILAGMYIVHTPSDGEVLAQPAINRNILAADPYYDVDLVEFALGIPLRHRIAISNETKTRLALEKRILHKLALRYLPEHIVYRKKGFVVSFDRDEHTQQLARMLPDTFLGIALDDIGERFAAGMLNRWLDETGVEVGASESSKEQAC